MGSAGEGGMPKEGARPEKRMAEIRYGDYVFEGSFASARLASGRKVTFTRSERALLTFLAATPRQIFTRNQILDAVSGHHGETGDRNIDFIVNRLRAKLGDSARAPALIATRYGEGYVWIAEPSSDTAVSAFLVIGPVFGIGRLADGRAARNFLDRLRLACDMATAPDQEVILVPGWRPEMSAPGAVSFSLDVSFHGDDAGLHCAAILRDGPTRQILRAERLILGQVGHGKMEETIAGLTAQLKRAAWRHIAFVPRPVAAPTDEPLQLRMHRAALLLARSAESWLESEAQLAQARAERPEDPEVALMWAMQTYYKTLTGGARGLLDSGQRDALEVEIEATVFACLPRLDGNPLLVLAAAKLLHFSGRGHLDLAEDLATRAFTESTAFAASFATLAQIKASRGLIQEALRLYDEGLELAEKGSEFEVFIMVLRISALMAIDDREAVDRARAALYAVKPTARMKIGLLMASPEPKDLPADLAALFAGFSAERAASLVLYLYYISARLFEQERHRENIMRGLVTLVVRHFGRAAVPEEVWRAVPGLDPEKYSQILK